jgi:hypothetical protein
MPTDLPPEHPVLRFVRWAGWLRAETIAWTLIWRFRLAGALKSAAIGIAWAALACSKRKYLFIVLMRSATVILSVSAWVKPDPEGDFMRYQRRREDP